MKIVALGSSFLEIEFACLATLSKFVREGHEVHVIVMRDINYNIDWTDSEAREFYKQFGLNNILIMEKRDYSTAVTQENASALNLHIKRISPEIVIMPFWKSKSEIHRIVSRTALIACRGIGSIFMYEPAKNPDFMPTVSFLVLASDYARKVSPTVAHSAKMSSSYSLNTETIQTLAENIGTADIDRDEYNGEDYPTATESFESHRMLLAENSWL